MSDNADYTRTVVLGAGAWGTALANVAARAGMDVTLWARNPDRAAEMTSARENARSLPGIPLEDRVTMSSDLACLAYAQLVLSVVPAQATRMLFETCAGRIAAGVPVVICAKGIERGTGAFMSDIAAELLPGNPAAILSGPSFAHDVARGLPTAVTLAAADAGLARDLASALATHTFRPYHATDVRGVEIGGAAKNVLAIASGIVAGRQLGASASAALIARGFAELRRFGAAWGAQPETFMGLSGLGDLILTCSTEQSRNFAFGLALGRGAGVDEAAGGKLAEGAHTAAVLMHMARGRNVDMPVSEAVDMVLTGKLDIPAAIERLLSRPLRGEQ